MGEKPKPAGGLPNKPTSVRIRLIVDTPYFMDIPQIRIGSRRYGKTALLEEMIHAKLKPREKVIVFSPTGDRIIEHKGDAQREHPPLLRP